MNHEALARQAVARVMWGDQGAGVARLGAGNPGDTRYQVSAFSRSSTERMTW